MERLKGRIYEYYSPMTDTVQRTLYSEIISLNTDSSQCGPISRVAEWRGEEG